MRGSTHQHLQVTENFTILYYKSHLCSRCSDMKEIFLQKHGCTIALLLGL